MTANEVRLISEAVTNSRFNQVEYNFVCEEIKSSAANGDYSIKIEIVDRNVITKLMNDGFKYSVAIDGKAILSW